MNNKLVNPISVLVFLVGLAGCATSQPPWETIELGSSVASMVEGQIDNPEAAANADGKTVEGSEGEKTAKVLQAWRDSLAAPSESAGNVTINVGN